METLEMLKIFNKNIEDIKREVNKYLKELTI